MFPSDLTLLGLKVLSSQSTLLKGSILIMTLYGGCSYIASVNLHTIYSQISPQSVDL